MENLVQAETTKKRMKRQESPECLTLTVEQAAIRLGLSRPSAFKLVNAKKIPSLRLGRRIVIPKVQFERFLAGQANNQG